ncbi:MAG TPA: methylated-DNA--[protein]-cysteine S-methyltransferase [Ktedonobacteraceae bacterium]|nr:methylated-DNA--[protein]-cysteine S-methyltransferase [Ktedonobacteraceae bacterium]
MRKTEQVVYWDAVKFRDWTFYLAATEAGLCSVMLPNGTFETMRDWVVKYVPGAQLVEDAEQMQPYTRQLTEYLRGERSEFTLPLDLRGTPFQVDVWNALRRIPYGETRSYSDIAQDVDRVKAVRAVGAANGANPIPVIIPCHRVIGKDGSLTGYGGGLPVKAELLRLEGMAERVVL